MKINLLGSGLGSVCKNPELIEDAWVYAPIISLSKTVTSYLPVLAKCHAVDRPETPAPTTTIRFFLFG